MSGAAAGFSALGAGIDATAQFGSDMFNYYQQRKQWDHERDSAQRQANWNRQQWEDTNQWNLDMWNRSNEYNSPQAQMGRLKAAGLNPRLIYGSNSSGAAGQSSPAQAKQAAGYQRPKYEAPQLRGQYNFGNIMPSLVQTNNVKAATEATNAQTAGQLIKNLGFAQDNIIKTNQAEVSGKIKGYQVTAARLANDNAMQDIQGKIINNSFQGASIGERLQGLRLNNQKLQKQIAHEGHKIDQTKINNSILGITLGMKQLGIENAPTLVKMAAMDNGKVVSSIKQLISNGKAKLIDAGYTPEEAEQLEQVFRTIIALPTAPTKVKNSIFDGLKQFGQSLSTQPKPIGKKELNTYKFQTQTLK